MLQNIQKTHVLTILPPMCISHQTIQLDITWVYFHLACYSSSHYMLLIKPLHVTHQATTCYSSSHYMLLIKPLHVTHQATTCYSSSHYMLLIKPLHVYQLVLILIFCAFAHITICKGFWILKATRFISRLFILTSTTLITLD